MDFCQSLMSENFFPFIVEFFFFTRSVTFYSLSRIDYCFPYMQAVVTLPLDAWRNGKGITNSALSAISFMGNVSS